LFLNTPFLFGLGVRRPGGVRLMPLARAATDVGASSGV